MNQEFYCNPMIFWKKYTKLEGETFHSLLVACYCLRVPCYYSFVARYFLLVAHCLLLSVRYILIIAPYF